MYQAVEISRHEISTLDLSRSSDPGAETPNLGRYPELREELLTWRSLVSDRINFVPIFRTVKELIAYGDDGYVILKHLLENCRNAQYMRRYYQDALTTMKETADQEIYLQRQLESAGSLDSLLNRFREGDFTNLPIEKEQRGYIQKAYEFLRFSEKDRQWLLTAKDHRDWSNELREAVGVSEDGPQMYWCLGDVRRILRNGWRHYVKELLIAKGLGKESLTLPEIFEYCGHDEFEKACRQQGEKTILESMNNMRIYDWRDWEKAQITLSGQFPQLVSV